MGPARTRASVAEGLSGYGPPVFGRWRNKERHRANKQQGDPRSLERAGDPRGGLQEQACRSGNPRDPVESEGVAMSGPGGAPQEGESVEQRRRRDR